ncbi:uncharacterized protein [Eleutherodactylus coqui]|uniref:uncharacterized protein n=1 Tax=Eleutherodactylus coqui TaxID=57060 RepID=UPI003463063C
MKLAVIFLCLSVASFIGTKTGSGGTSVTMTNLVILLGCAVGCIKSCNCAEMCDDGQKLWRQIIAAEDLFHFMCCLSKTLGIPIREILEAVDCSDEEIAACVSGDVDRIIAECDNIKELLEKILHLLEYICATINLLFLDILSDILTWLDWDDLISWCSFHTSIDEVISTVDIPLKNLVGGVLGSVLGGHGGLGGFGSFGGLEKLLNFGCKSKVPYITMAQACHKI